jgi:superfamily II DNA or RNA helicase
MGAKGLKIYFKAKDTVEDYLTTLVKAGEVQLREAQEGIAKDWTQYRDAALKRCAVQECGGAP